MALLGAVSDQLGTLGPRREHQRHASGQGRCEVMAAYPRWQRPQICGHHKSTSCTDECGFPVLHIYCNLHAFTPAPWRWSDGPSWTLVFDQLGTLGPRRERQRHTSGYGRCGVMAAYPRWQSTQTCGYHVITSLRAGRGRSAAAQYLFGSGPTTQGHRGGRTRVWRRSHTASVGASHRQRR
jgi:hypothetical protein